MNKDGLLNNPGTYVFFDFQFCRSSLVTFVLSCILFLFKMSRKSMLLINYPSKRGDMEIATRSSVSSPSQVKMTLKLTASR